MIRLPLNAGMIFLFAIGAAEAAACVQCYGANGQGVPPETCIGRQK